MIEVRKTDAFDTWLHELVDPKVKAIILARIGRLELGHFGDMKSVGGHVSELRFHRSPGYRVYFTRRGGTVVVLLAGGTKRTQKSDIARAQQMAQEV